METDTRIDALERVCRAKADRSVGLLAQYAQGGLEAASESVVRARPATVVVLTGAYIPWGTQAAAETDGPPGAALLAGGLVELGISARLLTDPRCQPIVAAAGQEVAANMPIDVCDGSAPALERLVVDYTALGVTHLVAVERLGPASDGIVRNFRGEDVTSVTAPLDPLFAGDKPWTTIGVGDGGNELGMGKVPEAIVADAIPHGRDIHCMVGCDHLIVASVSNWGALGLLLAIALHLESTNGTALAYVSAQRHDRVLDACLRAGAVDGTLGRSAPSVDGVNLRENDAVIAQLRVASELED